MVARYFFYFYFEMLGFYAPYLLRLMIF